MDVVKYAAPELNKEKILIPTTFGTGAEMTLLTSSIDGSGFT